MNNIVRTCAHSQRESDLAKRFGTANESMTNSPDLLCEHYIFPKQSIASTILHHNQHKL